MITVQRTMFLWTGLLALCTKAQIYNPSDYGCGTSQAIIQCYWDAPALPDNSTTITLGENYTLRWDTLLASTVDFFLPGADPTSLTLFITPSDGSVAGETLISARVNVNTTTSLTWVVQSITPGHWTFRFVEYGTSYTPDSDQISSPRVVVLVASSASPTTTSSATASSPAASAASTSSSSSSTGSAVPAATTSAQAGSSKSSSNSLSSGAIAGIVIGGTIVILLIVGMFLFFRKRPHPKEISAASDDFANSAHAMNDYKYSHQQPYSPTPAYADTMANLQPLHEAPSYTAPSELPGSRHR